MKTKRSGWHKDNNRRLQRTLFGILLIWTLCITTWVRADLVAHWPLNETSGNVAGDATGNGHDGALLDFPEPDFTPWVPGRENGALSFEGGGYVEVTALPDLTSTTWSAWVKQSEPTSFASLITATFEGAGAGHILDLAGVDGGSEPRVVWNHNVDRADLRSSEAVPLGEWAHIVMTLDADTGVMNLYVNGELKDSSGSVTTTPFSTINLGRRLTSQAHFFTGLMEDVRVYDRPLSELEVLALAGDPNVDLGQVDLEAGLVAHWPLNETSGNVAVDATGNGHDGTLLDFPEPDFTPWVAGRENGALSFEGGGYVEVTALPDLTSTTWSAWVKQSEPTSFASIITATFEGAGAGHILDLAGVAGGSEPRVVWNHNVDRADLRSPEAVPLGEWAHIAMTLDASAGVMNLYVNGELKDSADSVTTTAFSTINLGRRLTSGAHLFTGLMEDVRVYNRALSIEEINDLIGVRVTGPPRITRQPESQSVFPGTTVAFSVEVDGALPFEFQWFKDGEAVRGAIGPSLTLARIYEQDAGDYHVSISNPEGVVESDVTVLEAKPIEFLTSEQVAWWRMDETSGLVALDSSGNNLDGELIDFADEQSHWVDGMVGGALEFQGAPNRVVVPGSTDLTFPEGATFAFWIKPASYGPSVLAPGRDWTFRQGRILHKGADFDISLADGAAGPQRTLLVAGGSDFDGSDFDEFTSAAAHGPARLVELDVWQHFVVVFESGQVRLFKDGFEVGQPQPLTIGGENTENIVLGAFDEGADIPRFFEGLMDEVGIWARPLTDNEILVLAGHDADGPPRIIEQPEAVTRLIGGSVVLSVLAEGKRPVTYQWFFNGNEIAGATERHLVLPNVRLEQAGTYTVLISNEEGETLSEPAELTVNPIEDVSAGLIAYYPFDEVENSTVLDASGHGHHGELINFFESPVVPGMIGGAFDFDGTDDFIVVPHSALLNLTDQATISLWINPRSFGQPLNNHGRIVRKTTNYDFRIVVGQPYLVDPGLAGPVVDLNLWQHFAVVVQDGLVEFFKNGQSLGNPVPGSLGAVNTDPLVIGNFQADLEISRLFDGLMDDLGIWNRALNAEEIRAIYDSGSIGRPLTDEFEPLSIRSLSVQPPEGAVRLVFFSPFLDREFAVQRKTGLAANEWIGQQGVSFSELGQGEYEAAFPLPAEHLSFFRIVAMPPAALLEADFEDGAPGWTHGGENDSWALGMPTSGPGSAVVGENVFATNLDGNFNPNSNAYLRSPVIDLMDVSRARLVFSEYRHVDPNPSFHRTIVNVLDAQTQALIEELAVDAGQTDGWQQRALPLGSGILGREIILEFRLITDAFNLLPGWYIDHVRILPD